MNIEVTASGRVIIGGLLPSTPAEAFAIAERICAAAYAAQGGSSINPDDRYTRQLDREAREARGFEELYCTLRDIADDWHREAVCRRDGKDRGAFDHRFCDANRAIELTIRTALERVKDWDY